VPWFRYQNPHQLQAAASTALRPLSSLWNIHTAQTSNSDDTIRYIAQLRADYLAKGPPAVVLGNSDYLGTMYVGRKRGLLPVEYVIGCLRLISGVGIELARAIAEQYPSLRALVAKYNSLSAAEGNVLFAELRRGNAERRVGEKLSTKIRNFIMNPEAE